MRNKILLIIILVTCWLGSGAQNVTLENCQESARNNYPLVKQYGLIEQTTQYNISNANKAYLPQLSLSAKATYQSDVTEIPASLGQILTQVSGRPVSFEGMSKDQYQAVAEASQLLWDGGVTSAQKQITKAGAEVEKKKLDVDLFALNERINQLYFGILLLNEQLEQNNILLNELETNYNRINAYKQNGIANQADLDAFKVEILNAKQRKTDIIATRNSYIVVLGAMTGMKINENSVFKIPEIDLAILNDTIVKRPELALFEAQNKMFESQKSLLNAGNLPRIGAFIQGGVGKPGLNMFVNEISPFYIGGLRLSWNFSGLYSQKNNLSKIELNKKTLDIQKETFLFNTDLKLTQQKTEIQKLLNTVKTDEEIISLRANIKKATSAKLENGTATVTDLIREVNAENQAKQLKSLHDIQLIMSIYQFKNITNN